MLMSQVFSEVMSSQQHNQSTQLQDGLWMDLLKRQFVYKMETKKMAPEVKTTNLMIKTFDDPKHEMLTIDAVNMESDNWVFGCKATTVYKVVKQS